jgi:hypothetical protein
MFSKNRNKKVRLCLMVVTSCFILAALWAVLATPDTALAKPGKGGGGKKQEIQVRVTFDDSKAGVKSDGLGSYTRERGNKVKAFIGLGGQLRLQTWDSTVRSILLDIPDISDPDCPDGGFGHANLVTLGEDDNDDGFLTEPQLDPGVGGDRLNLLEMGVGSSTRAGLRIGFPVPDNKNGDAWYVLFGGGQAGLVTVTRESDSMWTIEAIEDIEAGDSDLAALVRSGQGQEPCNHVSMPFSITVEILP